VAKTLIPQFIALGQSTSEKLATGILVLEKSDVIVRRPTVDPKQIELAPNEHWSPKKQEPEGVPKRWEGPESYAAYLRVDGTFEVIAPGHEHGHLTRDFGSCCRRSFFFDWREIACVRSETPRPFSRYAR